MRYDRRVLAGTLLLALCACTATAPAAVGAPSESMPSESTPSDSMPTESPPAASTPPVAPAPAPVTAPARPGAPVADDGNGGDRCDPAPAQWAVGQVASAEVVARVRADSHAQVVRVIHPGEMITMDYSFVRVDIRVDAGNRVLKVSCG
jgi:hypothetical protein